MINRTPLLLKTSVFKPSNDRAYTFLEKYYISNYSTMKTMIYHDESSYGTVQKMGKLDLL